MKLHNLHCVITVIVSLDIIIMIIKAAIIRFKKNTSPFQPESKYNNLGMSCEFHSHPTTKKKY